MKIIVYTANIGHYDIYRNLYPKDNSVEYYYFTDDKKLELDGWKVKLIEKQLKDNRRVARYYKMNPHKVLPKHDISIWIDARFTIFTDKILEFVEQYKNYDISCFPHPHGRDCLYDEADICKTFALDKISIIDDQMKKFQKEGFPKHYGLFAAGILIRKNNKAMKKFNEMWWDMISNGSKRDQLSQCYISWKTGIDINPIMEGNVYHNLIAETNKHRQYKIRK